MNRMQLGGGLVLAGLLCSVPLQADDLSQETARLCDRMKHCALSNIQDSGLPPEMQTMIRQQLDMACQGMEAKYGVMAQSHELYQPALACVKSLQSLSCAEMEEDNDDALTPACERYEALSEKY
ncbi:hypothetical protein IMCC21906_01162 [Spongiibacter sp. IMCC21906]|uniref:hypothetical protein n=1 Tax=Spongiibacter sp. IMCC21906 TaxID=1620392 RepID=UPI00062DF8AE|nr:hypothetical protein [Spongiibacter sp. IMCC21906]AKH68841.1 hypothetical protein IMCC21906_01162 [Spongiibacter sp. IMCC21906]